VSETEVDRSGAYCIVGAGAGGLAAAKNLLEFGIDVDVIEREGEVGGNWNYSSPNSGAYRSIHLITSKPYIQYLDYPIPDHFPTYLGRRHALEYLRSYAQHFGFYDRIEFRRSVEWIDRRDGSPHWIVTLDGGERRRYAGVIVANGHNWSPRYPDFPGRFEGTVLHSADYKTPELFEGKRVLVVGGGTSGADIAVESSLHADSTTLSIRRGCYYWPKYLFGLPTDVVYENILKFRFPLPVVRFFGGLFLRLNSAGNPDRYGLPKPPHKLLEEHFVLNSTLLYSLGHGEITPRPNVAELRGDRVRFADGTEEPFDVIVYATGYRQTELPFLDRRHLNWADGTPGLHLQMLHPDYDNLFLVGLFQTSTGNWQIMDYQSRLIARYIHLSRADPGRVAWLRAEKRHPAFGPALNGGISFYDSHRHQLQVDHFSYRRRLRKMAGRLAVPPGRASTEPIPVSRPIAAAA
jgi:cation diffusion facilitator CzcD-associated flavoprotein CzcO